MMFLKWWKYSVEEFPACGAASGIVSSKLKSIKISHLDGKKIVLNFFVKGKKYFFVFPNIIFGSTSYLFGLTVSFGLSVSLFLFV